MLAKTNTWNIVEQSAKVYEMCTKITQALNQNLHTYMLRSFITLHHYSQWLTYLSSITLTGKEAKKANTNSSL